MENVATRIRRQLKRSKKSQNQMAADLGISKGYLSQILSGKRRPSLIVAVRLQEMTGIPASDFAEVA